uniref:Dedicator of cytokinesis C/D N-terminal domain-containing protein n=1 Tax=Poecilia mexicana TaxID=48701 RepID=A0A3B3WVU5_9TELE
MAAESTRRFTKNLLKPGSAAEIRQTACNAVRHSAVTVSGPLWIQEKPKLIDPLDYEAVISELWEELKEDPLRELLLFPDNDFSGSYLHSDFIESLAHKATRNLSVASALFRLTIWMLENNWVCCWTFVKMSHLNPG